MIHLWIQQRLEESQLSEQELARLLGITEKQFRSYLMGKEALPESLLPGITAWLGDPWHPPGVLMVMQESSLKEGMMVISTLNKRGPGKITELKETEARVAYFHAPGILEEEIVPISSLLRVRISPNTRCYIWDEERQEWIAGAVGQYDLDSGEYEVLFSQRNAVIPSGYWPEDQIYIRSYDRPLPANVFMKARIFDSVKHYKKRTILSQRLAEHRARVRGLSGLISAKIRLLPHQVEVVQRVVSDAVPRYILADEVGMGKTIEALAIVRQYLLDEPRLRVRVIAPSGLVSQWLGEWHARFAILPNDTRLECIAFDDVDVALPPVDMLVIDEAHQCARWAWEAPELYAVLERWSRHAKVLLLLTATPVATHADEYLAMLHLLEPEVYRLEHRNSFRQRVAMQDTLGEILLGLDEDAPAFLLEEPVQRLQELLREDENIAGHCQRLLVVLKEGSPEQYLPLLRELKTLIAEGYRLHYRLLRHRRREAGLDTLRARSQFAQEWALDQRERYVYELLEQWRLDALSHGDYRRVYLALLSYYAHDLPTFSRAVRVRLGEVASKTEEEQELQTMPLFPGEEELLRLMLEECARPVDEEEKDKRALIAEICKRVLARGEKVIVFASQTDVAQSLGDLLMDILENEGREEVVYRRLASMGEEGLKEVEWFIESPGGAVLVLDASGEEGLNLQVADHLVMYDFPLSPNRWEQRLGRVDRIGREEPFRVYIYVGPELEEGYTPFEVWVKLLDEGLHLFKESVAPLQFFIEEQLPQWTTVLFQEGATGLINRIPDICNQRMEYLRQIERQDVLHALEERPMQVEDSFRDLREDDERWKDLQDAFLGWLKALHFQYSYDQKHHTFSIRSSSRTDVPADMWLHRFLPFSQRPLSFRRATVLTRPRTDLLRLGHAFFDHMMAYQAWDDRGRVMGAYVQLEDCPQSWWGFRIDWIVEGDIAPMVAVMEAYGRNRQEVEPLLRRRMERFFQPVWLTVFVNTEGEILSDESFREVLERIPWNIWVDDLGMQEHRDKWKEFVAAHEWSRVVDKAVEQARAYLISQVTGLQETAIRWVRDARIRHKSTLQLHLYHQRMTREAFEIEEALWEALEKGISSPVYWPEAMAFLVIEPKRI